MECGLPAGGAQSLDQLRPAVIEAFAGPGEIGADVIVFASDLLADPEKDGGPGGTLLGDDEPRQLESCVGPVPDSGVTEQLLHGYDMAVAGRRPWPIRPHHAALTLFGYGPCFGLCVNPVTAAGHNAAYGVELRTAERFTVRFVDGEYRLEPSDSGPVDCTLTADPVSFLLVGSGRLSQWAAIALGGLEVGGNRPDLALGFTDLFLFP